MSSAPSQAPAQVKRWLKSRSRASTSWISLSDKACRGPRFPTPRFLASKGSGRVLAVGDGVENVAVGQRIAWEYPPGSHAQRIAIPATSLVPVPDTIDDPPRIRDHHHHHRRDRGRR